MNIHYRKLIAFAAALVVAGMLTSSASAQTAGDLYKAKCAVCHAADGSGDTPAGKKMGVKSLSAPEVAKNSDATWFEITKKGKGKMPGYEGKLTDDQIKDVIKYIRGLGKK